MEWERAKNYILIAFVMLNLGLAFLLHFEDRRFTLTGDRVRTIHEVLANNNIILYTAPPRRFTPMPHLDVSGYYYDVDLLLEIFFGEAEFFEIEMDAGHYIFETENGAYGRLEISNGFVTFDNRDALGENDEGEISHTEAIAIADAFISLHFDDFVRDLVITDDFGGVRITYRQEYRGRLIHSNYIVFLISARGIEWIDMQFGRIISHSADARMIFAPDEILLTFMQHVQHEAANNPKFISQIDIVYFQEYLSDERGSIYPAVPFYRIFVIDNDMEFLINAYTNTIIN
ncbi:MAG: two-component system regulatory protein YycI [Defluviitaleaceae bacterium]|nr:two-component system regulatory protein YycI [Defluviitaleaceae bacterium]